MALLRQPEGQAVRAVPFGPLQVAGARSKTGVASFVRERSVRSQVVRGRVPFTVGTED